MSLGNVSYARTNTDYFRQAIVYLRRASGIPDFPLPAHLQRYGTNPSRPDVTAAANKETDIWTITDDLWTDTIE